MTGGRAGQASEAAVEAADKVVRERVDGRLGFNMDAYGKAWTGEIGDTAFVVQDAAAAALDAAHDPALGPKRSVCLEDVVKELDGIASQMTRPHRKREWVGAARFIERRFTGEADDGSS